MLAKIEAPEIEVSGIETTKVVKYLRIIILVVSSIYTIFFFIVILGLGAGILLSLNNGASTFNTLKVFVNFYHIILLASLSVATFILIIIRSSLYLVVGLVTFAGGFVATTLYRLIFVTNWTFGKVDLTNIPFFGVPALLIIAYKIAETRLGVAMMSLEEKKEKISSPADSQERNELSFAARYEKSPWSWRTLFIVSALANFAAGGIIAGINWRRMGKPILMWPTIIVCYAGAVVHGSIPWPTGGARIVLGVLVSLAVAGLLWLWQRDPYRSWQGAHPEAEPARPTIPILILIAYFCFGYIRSHLPNS